MGGKEKSKGLIRVGLSVFLLILALTGAWVMSNKKSALHTLIGRVEAATYQRYTPHIGMGPCNVFFSTPPEATTLIYQNQSALELRFMNNGGTLPCQVQPETITTWVYEYPISLSFDDSRITLNTATHKPRGNGKYCLYGYKADGSCNVISNFYSLPDFKLSNPYPDGNQQPGYETYTEFCYPATSGGGCWFYGQSFLKNSKFCNTVADCGCRGIDGICTAMNKWAGSARCTAVNVSKNLCDPSWTTFSCVDNVCKVSSPNDM